MKISQLSTLLFLISASAFAAIEQNQSNGSHLGYDLAASTGESRKMGNDSNLLIVFYVQIMPDDFVMQWICPYISRHLLSLNP
uniref:hypothetical protein n=1 Tax=Escherichia coli TaxID=562 RepID=UPI001ABC6AD8